MAASNAGGDGHPQRDDSHGDNRPKTLSPNSGSANQPGDRLQAAVPWAGAMDSHQQRAARYCSDEQGRLLAVVSSTCDLRLNRLLAGRRTDLRNIRLVANVGGRVDGTIPETESREPRL